MKAGSKTTKVDAEKFPDLIAGKGKASVTIKAPRSGIVRTTLVDAAGKRSAVKSLKVSKIKTTRTNVLTYAPRGGPGFYTAVAVPAGTRVRVKLRVSPKLSGVPVFATVFGAKAQKTVQARVSRSGAASLVLALPAGAGIAVAVQVPRKKGNGISWTQQPFVYYTVG